MSQADQFLRHSEESDAAGRHNTRTRKGSPASHTTDEYHLIDLSTGFSHGGFESLSGARQFAREKALQAWDIFHGNLRVEYHDPRGISPDDGKQKPMIARL
jgi:hypothetical protein